MMKNLGIKFQLRLTTLIPVLLVALLFAIFYNGQFGRDLDQHMLRLGEAYIRQLLPAAQFALMQKDQRTLQGLINASTINPELKAVAFYNAEGRLLAYRGGKHALHAPFKPPAYTGDYIEHKRLNTHTLNFIAPITIPKYNLYSSTILDSPLSPVMVQADDILGWLSIDIDTQSTLIKQYQMLIVTIFITLFGILIGLTIHYFLSKRIYLPISRLKRSMNQILSNEYETKIHHISKGDLGIIEQGCIKLQKKYLNTVSEMNHHIEVATEDLQQALEMLEEKNIELSMEKKKADEKSRQKSEFIANMSHEIRTPMNGVIGFTNVLLESRLDPLQLDYVKTIKSSATDLLTIINDILDYSKMDAGKLHLDCIPLDIRGCIDEVLSLCAPNAHKKGLDLIPVTDVNVPRTVLGDPLRIKQIISNLVNNAVKFTDQGHVLIKTKIAEEQEHHYRLELSITDTGIGIDEEDQSKLFQAFNQADTTITRRYGGSGLGLVICKKLTEEMQGSITLSSIRNQGSTFTVTILVEKLAANEIEKNQIHRFSHLRVICFDENPLHLDAMCNGLGFWGIRPERCTQFEKLKTLMTKANQYQMAFINVQKGNESRIAELTKSHPEIPVVLVAKFAISDYEQLGARAFLFKPISIQKLHDKLDELLNEQPSPPAPKDNELKQLREQLSWLKPQILIAEDNPVNRMLMHSQLNEYCQLDMVENGEEARKSANLKRYQVILLDLQMPELNGLEAATAIRHESLLNKHTPIVLVSANGIDSGNDEIKKAGIEHSLQKPLAETQLLSLIIRIVDKLQHSPIDWSLCLQKASGNQKMAEEFLYHFTIELKNNRHEFKQLLKKGDIKAIGELAHKLHGACCFCGVPQLQKLVMQVEKISKIVNDTIKLMPYFDAMIEQIDAVLLVYEQEYRH